jgi:hypothetical protein
LLSQTDVNGTFLAVIFPNNNKFDNILGISLEIIGLGGYSIYVFIRTNPGKLMVKNAIIELIASLALKYIEMFANLILE